MPIPTVITDLSTTASSNYPDGDSESPIVLDDVQRAHAAFIAQSRDDPTAYALAPVPVAKGGTGSATAANARTALGAAASGLATASGLTMSTARVLGRTTAATGAIEELTAAQLSAFASAATDTAQGAIELATNAEVVTGTDTTRAVTPASMKAGLGATGTAPIFALRAWINFNGTGTVAVKGSGNATLTDNGTGDYTVTFTTAMPDANYSVTFGLGSDTTSSACAVNVVSQLAGSIRFQTFRWNGSTIGTATDLENISVTIVR